MDADPYHADPSLKGKLRRRLVRLQHRRPCAPRLGSPLISFSFDDAPKSSLTTAAQVLERFDVRGTYFVSAGLAGQDSFVGPLGEREDYQRVAGNGHEIACHTYSHMDCGKADGPATKADVTRNSDAFEAWGLKPPETFAYPYGDVGPAAKRVLADRFALVRALHPDVIEGGADLAQAPAVGVEGEDGEAKALHWMEQALRRKAWVILFTHDVDDAVTRYGCATAAFERLVSHAVAGGFEVVTVAEGARRMRMAA